MATLALVERRGYAFVLVAALLWGTTGTAQALGPETSTPIGVGAVRMVIGGAALILVALAARRFPARRWWFSPAALITGVAMAAYQPLFFSAVNRTGVAVGTIVALGSAPLFAGGLATVMRRDRLTMRWAAATALAIVGAALLLSGGPDIGVDPLGIALALGAGAAYAVYAIAAKSLVESVSAVGSVTLTFGWAAIISLPVLLVVDTGWLLGTEGIALGVHLGVVTTALAYLLFARGLADIPVSSATTLTLAEPATAAILGVLVLDEQLTAQAWVGIALIAGGLAVLVAAGQPSIAGSRVRRSARRR